MRKFILSLIIIFCFSQGLLAQSTSIDEDYPIFIGGALEEENKLYYQFAMYQYVDKEWEQLPLKEAYSIILSPDREWAAYLHVPPFLQPLMADEELTWLYGLSDITLLNLRDGSERKIAAQPDTTTDVEHGYEGGIKRSLPHWSPDSKALTWTEEDYPIPRLARLLVYDVESQQTRIVDNQLPRLPEGYGLPRNLSWGAPGIGLITGDGSSSISMSFRLYDPETGLIKRSWIPYHKPGEYPLKGPIWIKELTRRGEHDIAVMQAFGEQWYLFDPNEDELSHMKTHLEKVSAITPLESLRIEWKFYLPGHEFELELLTADGVSQFAWPMALRDNYNLMKFAISPSGQTMAYKDGDLYLWQDGKSTRVDTPEELNIEVVFWGPDYWRPAPRTQPSQ